MRAVTTGSETQGDELATTAAAEKSRPRGRDASLDLVRAVAMALVVLCHFGPLVMSHHPAALSVCTSLGFLGVPLFVMLTGYLMLGRTYDDATLARFLKRNLLGMLVAFEIWNALWCVLGNNVPALLPGGNGLPTDPVEALHAALFLGPPGNALWYLHMSLALYLGIPVVSWTLQKLRGPYRVLLGVCLVACGTLVPSLVAAQASLRPSLIPLAPVLEMSVFSASVWGHSAWLLFLVVGYAARTLRDRLRPAPLALGLVASVAAHSLLNTRLILSGRAVLNDYDFVLVVASSVLLFLLLLSLGRRIRSQRAASALAWVSERSFGVYVTHLWVIGGLFTLIRHFGIHPEGVNSLSHDLTLLLAGIPAVCCVSLAVVQLLALVPPVRRWALLMRDRTR